MEIYQLAMDMEKEGMAYYMQLVDLTDNRQIKKVFEILAGEEKHHFHMLEAMQNKIDLPSGESQLYDAERIFVQQIIGATDFQNVNTILEAYAQAVKLEDNSINYYKKMAKTADDPVEKAILLRMHFEEKKHKLLLENMMELVRDTQMHISSAEITDNR